MNHRPACELINFPFRSLTFAITISEAKSKRKARFFDKSNCHMRGGLVSPGKTYDGRFR